MDVVYLPFKIRHAFLLAIIFFFNSVFGAEVVRPPVTAMTTSGKVECPKYLSDWQSYRTSRPNMLKVCGRIQLNFSELSDPVYLQSNYKSKLDFLNASEASPVDACVAGFTSECPGGRGKGCERKAKDVSDKVGVFYYANSFLHDELASSQSELKYINQVLAQKGEISVPVPCNSGYSDLRKQCATDQCKVGTDEFKNITSDILKTEKDISDLKQEAESLKRKNKNGGLSEDESKANFVQIQVDEAKIQFLQSQNPIVEGDQFKKYYKPGVPSSVDRAVLEQLKQNQKKLSETIKEDEPLSICTMGTMPCDFAGLKNTLLDRSYNTTGKYFSDKNKKSDVLMKQAQNAIECEVTERKINSEQNGIIASAGIDIGLLIVTWGASTPALLAKTAFELRGAATVLEKVLLSSRLGVIAGGAVYTGYNAKKGIEEAYSTCTKDLEEKLTQEQKQTQCSSKQFSRVYRDVRACIIQGGLAALSALPVALGVARIRLPKTTSQIHAPSANVSEVAAKDVAKEAEKKLGEADRAGKNNEQPQAHEEPVEDTANSDAQESSLKILRGARPFSAVQKTYPRLQARTAEIQNSVPATNARNPIIKDITEINYKESDPFRPKKYQDTSGGRSPHPVLSLIPNLDPTIRDTIVKAHNALCDPKYVSAYMQKLFKEAAAWMDKTGNGDKIGMLRRGYVSEQAIAVIISQRLKEAADGEFTTMLTFSKISSVTERRNGRSGYNEEAFMKAITGPFFDRALKGYEHGFISHMMQRDMVRQIVHDTMGSGNTQKFWDFLATDKGHNWWVDLFDSAHPSNFTKAENLNSFMEKHMTDEQ